MCLVFPIPKICVLAVTFKLTTWFTLTLSPPVQHLIVKKKYTPPPPESGNICKGFSNPFLRRQYWCILKETFSSASAHRVLHQIPSCLSSICWHEQRQNSSKKCCLTLFAHTPEIWWGQVCWQNTAYIPGSHRWPDSWLAGCVH